MNKGIWVEVKILPRKEILDVQGRAIVETLKQNNHPVTDCRYGKCIHLHLDVEDFSLAEQKVREIAEYVLYNPLTETFEMKVIK